MAGRVQLSEESWSRNDRWLRTSPSQQRAFDRIELILDATGALLDERYPEPLTVEDIARRANVRPATFYHYFHGVQAAYGALAARGLERVMTESKGMASAASGRLSLTSLIDLAADAALAAWAEQPGSTCILRLSEAMPAFQEQTEEEIEEAIRTDRLAPMVIRPETWDTDKRLVYATLHRVGRVMLSHVLAIEDPDLRRRQSDEFKLAMVSYLANYLE